MRRNGWSLFRPSWIPTLAPGASATLKIRYRVISQVENRFIARIRYEPGCEPDVDPNPLNNLAFQAVSITLAPPDGERARKKVLGIPGNDRGASFDEDDINLDGAVDAADILIIEFPDEEIEEEKDP